MVIETNNRVRLKEGRYLGFAEYGDAGGKPVFYFHGLPGSRLEARLGAKIGCERGIRIIAVDRPGFGLSDFKPDRRILDWPSDVSELADNLGIHQFSIMGLSGGGPYAAACARQIPERLHRVGIINGLGPCDAPGELRPLMRVARICFGLGRFCRWPISLVCSWVAHGIRHHPARMIKRLARMAHSPDQEILEGTEAGQILMESFREAIRMGTRGSVWEILLCSCPWEFKLQEIKAEVHLWYGEMDTTVPTSMGRYLAKMIPECRAQFFAHEGHYSLPVRHLDQILATLAGPRL